MDGMWEIVGCTGSEMDRMEDLFHGSEKGEHLPYLAIHSPSPSPREKVLVLER